MMGHSTRTCGAIFYEISNYFTGNETHIQRTRGGAWAGISEISNFEAAGQPALPDVR